ncbi:hypothetical protein BDN67DRAFT_260778 [Paxillus ammoniavirescens]|nr:hypothetical protein BDN67DRAFT_260778 [Paxillus ammoniavirescens]
MSSPSLRSMLPTETLELVLGHVSRTDLLPVLTTNSVFHKIAARVLYRTNLDVAAKHAVVLVKTLAHNDLYVSFVRQIELDWTGSSLTGNFLRLLNRTLKRLKHLLHLSLEFASHDNQSNMAWVLGGCTFSLKTFMTSMRCEPLLARFLETQNSITEVCLRGFNPPMCAFPLSSHALPRLAHFRTVLSSPRITADFVRDRPIESVSMSLYPGDVATSLDALLLSSKPVKRLTVMSFDVGEPAKLLSEIAVRVPGLEALHAVVLITQHSHELLVKTAPSLSQFKALKYLTFMAPSASTSLDDEKVIATLWHKACPTLRTIILPKGVVWGYTDGKWVSWQDVV